MQIVTTWTVSFRLDDPGEIAEMNKFRETHPEKDGWIEKASTKAAVFTKTQWSEIKFKVPV